MLFLHGPHPRVLELLRTRVCLAGALFSAAVSLAPGLQSSSPLTRTEGLSEGYKTEALRSQASMLTLTFRDDDGMLRTIDAHATDTVADLLAASPDNKRGRLLMNGEPLPSDVSLASCGITAESTPSLRVARRRRRLQHVDTNQLQQWSMLSPAARAIVKSSPAPAPEPELRVETAPSCATSDDSRRALEILELLEEDPHNFDLTQYSRSLLRELLVTMFETQDLLAPFGVSRAQLEAFVQDLCDEYAFLPFHSFVHAVDVTAGAYIGVRQLGGASRLRRSSQWALFLAAAGHDVGHPGTTNAYQKAVETTLYQEYGDDATLERMHTKLALQLIDKHDLLGGMCADDASAVRNLIEFVILGTDIGAHQSILSEFQAAAVRVGGGGSWPDDSCSSEEDAQLARMLLKCSDLGCCARNFTIGRHWADSLARESERQADLPGGSNGGMTRDTIAKCQTGFFKCICVPMFDVMAAALPEWESVAERVRENGELWSQLAESQAEER